MSELRKSVITADTKGDSAALAQSINTLRSYVSAHMNTDLGDGFYLTASYERAREAAVNAAADTTNPDSALYQKASVECQSAAARSVYGGYYVPCVLAKVKELGSSAALTSELQLPRYELYKIDFVSPLWSPDLAGFSALVSGLIVLGIIGRITGVIVLKLLIKRRFTSI
jgi:hypothetical protein